MGLDTYAVSNGPKGGRPAANPEHFAHVGSLVGGLLSGNGNDGSFRGKVYAHTIEELTGVSLYQGFIEPEIVANMADALDAVPEYTDDDVPSLRQFFAVCREHGYGLVGWW